MPIPYKFRRSLALVIPFFTAALFLGIINAFFGISASTNIAQTGVTLGFVMGILNGWLVWLIWKHRVP